LLTFVEKTLCFFAKSLTFIANLLNDIEYVLTFVENVRNDFEYVLTYIANVLYDFENVRSFVEKVRSLFVKTLMHNAESGRGFHNIPLSLHNAANEEQERGCLALMITVFL
jgi:hypothetical protein